MSEYPDLYAIYEGNEHSGSFRVDKRAPDQIFLIEELTAKKVQTSYFLMIIKAEEVLIIFVPINQ